MSFSIPSAQQRTGPVMGSLGGKETYLDYDLLASRYCLLRCRLVCDNATSTFVPRLGRLNLGASLCMNKDFDILGWPP